MLQSTRVLQNLICVGGLSERVLQRLQLPQICLTGSLQKQVLPTRTERHIPEGICDIGFS